jgi:hypothetical protein
MPCGSPSGATPLTGRRSASAARHKADHIRAPLAGWQRCEHSLLLRFSIDLQPKRVDARRPERNMRSQRLAIGKIFPSLSVARYQRR